MEQSDGHSWPIYNSLSLRQNQFRLLKLHPASVQQAPILIDLFNVDDESSELPEYDAISYRWGDPNNRRPLTANGKQILVTSSLHTALAYMRDKLLTKILWIDGVCINQDDTVERSQQVLKMGSIFSGAQCVRIFIGEAEDGDNMAHAMDLLSTLDTLGNRLRFIERVRVDQDGSRGLINMLRRPYWQRMWMFQEIVLSRKAVVHCGLHTIPWDNLRRLNTISGDPEMWFEAQVRCDWILELRRALFNIAHFFINKSEAQDIRNVLEPTRRLQCWDPRDALFAFIGVCHNIPIRADYSRSAQDVYIEFTRKLLQDGYDMSLLLTAGSWHPENGPNLNLPSWVPDYRGTHGVDIRYLAASHLEYFNASLGRKSPVRFPLLLGLAGPNDHSGRILGSQYKMATRGVLFDTVQTITALEKVQDSPRSLLRLTEPEGFGTSTFKEEYHAQVLFRIIIFDDKTFHKRGSRNLGYKSGNERYIRLALGLKIGDRTLRQHYEHLLETDLGQLEWHYREYLIRSKETSERSSSTFFVTKDNNIGKGPRDLDQGDRVAVIYGCRIPMLLRPSGTRYQLVGPCYIYGAMVGEIIKQSSVAGTSKFEETKILLV
ncbi:Heterokaryon incompatibility protein 6-OR allele [Apiospora saccharicola]|uniref:Heterokaryon incompatibility protein 6-OR allele n=1 Tax=Apiospora saccharicola TaxID=335842 RepID=A0ABR1UPB2_9PEZI